MAYTDAKKAFEDLKENFLNITTSKDNHHQIEGWTQAQAIHALKDMNSDLLLSLANSDANPVDTMIDLARIQASTDRRYREAEPDFCNPKEHLERALSRVPALRYNRLVLNELMNNEDRVKYNRAFQIMYEHIESQFKRPLVNVNMTQRREEMLDGLVLANPFELVKMYDDMKSRQMIDVSNDSQRNEQRKAYLNSIAETFVYISRETRAERLEENAQHHGIAAKIAGASTLGLGIASVAVAAQDDKPHHEGRTMAGGLGISALLIGLVAIAQLLRQSQKFTHALHQYAQVTDKIMANHDVRHNYYKFKTPRDDYNLKRPDVKYAHARREKYAEG